MIIVKEIPETISVNVDSKRLVLPSAKTWARNKFAPEALETLEDIKNTPISGIVINRVSSFGIVEVYDPRGFTCQITNFDELLEKVDISRGVIQEDLWYGLKNTREGSWILLTSEMKNQSKKAIQSVKDLKPGYVYKFCYNNTSLVYLGLIKWKDDYGVLRPHHTFVNPETKEITYLCWIKGSYFEELGYDDPDIYREAINVMLTSYQGSAGVKVSQIFLQPDLKYTTYHHSLLMPEGFKELPLWGHDSRKVVFVKQVSGESIRVITLGSSAYRAEKRQRVYVPGGWWNDEKVDTTEYNIEIDDISVSVNNGNVKKVNQHQYLHDLDFDLNNLEFLKNIVNDPSYKCLDMDDKLTWEKVHYFNYGLGRNDSILDCILTNGEKKSYSSIIKNSIKF